MRRCGATPGNTAWPAMGNHTAIRADTPALGGHWEGNHGDQ
ncbi:hypothetical protein ACFWRG_05540 [Micromonospora tulbaghiae]